MLLAIDIGNSNIVCGIFAESKLVFRFRLSTHLKATADEYGNLLAQLIERGTGKPFVIDAVVVGSVVPQLDSVISESCTRYFGQSPLYVGKNIIVDMPVLLENPAELGADRLINAYAAWQSFKQAMILVDLGTAITFDVVSKDGEYLGGAIAPGMELAADALFRATSKLPRVNLQPPKKTIGKNTTQAIQSGLFLGYVGLIDTLVQKIQDELGYTTKVIATGGWAHQIFGIAQTIESVEPDLTLEGLRLLYEHHRKFA